MWAIIGGSGFEAFDGFEVLEHLHRETPFGACSSGLSRVRLMGEEVIFLSRHGAHHELLPSEVNYRANIYRLKSLGVTKILAVSAVGSLKGELAPGDLVVPTQFIDRTKSYRRHTFCGDGVVAHVSLANPVNAELVDAVTALRDKVDFTMHHGDYTYLTVEGPYFSTRAESLANRQMGADILGMTGFPEYALAREAGIGYLLCAFVTDYDCWDPNMPHVTIDVVLALMKANNQKAFALAAQLIPATTRLLPNGCADQGIRSGLLTPWDAISDNQRAWLSVLCDQPVKEELYSEN